MATKDIVTKKGTRLTIDEIGNNSVMVYPTPPAGKVPIINANAPRFWSTSISDAEKYLIDRW